MARATETQHAYFQRIARANRTPTGDTRPRSLREMFKRLDAMRRTHGKLANPGIAVPDPDGDLQSHLAMLRHMRAVLKRRGSEGA